MTRLALAAVAGAAAVLLGGCSTSSPPPGPTATTTSGVTSTGAVPGPARSGTPSATATDPALRPVGTATALPRTGAHRVTPDEIRAVFEAQPWLGGVVERGERMFCGVDLLGQSPDLVQVYVWLDCFGYVAADPGTPVGGVKGPYRLDLGTGAVLSPEGGIGYDDDVATVFPAGLVDRIVHERVHVDQDGDVLAARARRAFSAATSSPAG